MSRGRLRRTSSWLWALAVATLLPGGCTTQPSTPPDERPALGNLLARGVPELPEALLADVQRYRHARSAALSGWLSSGILVATRFGETVQLHRVGVPLGAREQLTYDPRGVYAAFPPPADAGVDGFVYLRGAGEPENYQLFWYDLTTGVSRLLAEDPARYANVVWARAGNRFAYATTERNGRSWDIHVQGLDGSVRTVLETDGDRWLATDWSPAGDRLLVIRHARVGESYLYELEIENGRLTPLLDEDLRVSVGDARYGSSPTDVYFSADLGAEFVRLHRLDRGTRRIEVLTADTPWDVEMFSLAPDGRSLALVTNEGGFSRLAIWSLPDHVPLALPDLPAGVVEALHFSVDSARLAVAVDGPGGPADIFVLDTERRAVDRWTRSETGNLGAAALAMPELVSYSTFDREGDAPRRIPAFLYRPAGYGPHAVLVVLNGGAENQYRPRFSAMLQYYVTEMNIAVVAPNVRGSSGYGKSFRLLDDGFAQAGAVADIGALLDWIAADPGLDGSRVVVSGAAGGAHMALAAMTRDGARLMAGMAHVGLCNVVGVLADNGGCRQYRRRRGYGDGWNPGLGKLLSSDTLLTHASEIRPLMITQGCGDPRPPAGEIDGLVRELQARGAVIWYLLAVGAGGASEGKANSDYCAAATAFFLERYLLESRHPP